MPSTTEPPMSTARPLSTAFSGEPGTSGTRGFLLESVSGGLNGLLVDMKAGTGNGIRNKRRPIVACPTSLLGHFVAAHQLKQLARHRHHGHRVAVALEHAVGQFALGLVQREDLLLQRAG